MVLHFNYLLYLCTVILKRVNVKVEAIASINFVKVEAIASTNFVKVEAIASTFARKGSLSRD